MLSNVPKYLLKCFKFDLEIGPKCSLGGRKKASWDRFGDQWGSGFVRMASWEVTWGPRVAKGRQTWFVAHPKELQRDAKLSQKVTKSSSEIGKFKVWGQQREKETSKCEFMYFASSLGQTSMKSYQNVQRIETRCRPWSVAKRRVFHGVLIS